MKLHVVLPAKSKGSLGESGKGGAKRSLKPVKSVLAEIDDHKIDIVNSFSCAPAFDDPNNTSYVVYILILGFVIPNITLIFTSTEVLRLHRLVC